MNKTVTAKQCAIIWHVDDLKILHMDKKVVEDIINKLNNKFGYNSLLGSNKGNVLEFLGMTLHYTTK